MKYQNFVNLLMETEYEINLLVQEMIECHDIKPIAISMQLYWDTLEPVCAKYDLVMTELLFDKLLEYAFRDDQDMIDYFNFDWN